jgi:hypothetical protein
LVWVCRPQVWEFLQQEKALPQQEKALPQQASGPQGNAPTHPVLPVSVDVLYQFPKATEPQALVMEWCRPKAMERRVPGKA